MKIKNAVVALITFFFTFHSLSAREKEIMETPSWEMTKSGQHEISKGIKKHAEAWGSFGTSLETGKNRNGSIKDIHKIPEYVSDWIKTELAKVSEEPLQNLDSDAFFRKGKGRIIGYLKGYDPSLGFTTGIIYTRNEITREDYPVVVKVHPDGRFEADVPLIHPLHSYFILNEQRLPFYLEPGQTLAVILQWVDFLVAARERGEKRFFKDIVYKGNLAKVNKDLLGFELNYMNYSEFRDRVTNSAPETFKKEQVGIQKDNFKSLNTYLKANTISPKAASLLKGKILLQSGMRLLDFIWSRGYEKRQDTLNEVLKLPVPDNYYDFLNKMPLNDQSLLTLKSFSGFINRFEYCEPFKVWPKSKNIGPKLSLLEFLEKKGISLTEEKKELFQPIEGTPEIVDSILKQRQLFYEKHKKEITIYVNEYVKPLAEQRKRNRNLMARWELKDSVLTHKLGLNNNLIYDVTKVRSLKGGLGIYNREEAIIYWTQLQATIENEFLKKEGDRIFREFFPKIKENKGLDNSKMSAVALKSNSIPLPEGKAARIFKKIIEPYKGKILFVDFWATTCGPCIATIKRMKEVRKKYKDHKDFEFVFITGERISPQPDYDKFVKEQGLENIHRISVDDYLYLRQLFKFNGIPRYIVIDKNGNLINGDFPMHRFQSKLPKILAENK